MVAARSACASCSYDAIAVIARDTGWRASEANAAIDWVALTYFRWERVIQDLIEEAQQVLFRDEVSDDAKATAARRFAAAFEAGNNVDAAHAAAAHLPRGIGAPARQDGA